MRIFSFNKSLTAALLTAVFAGDQALAKLGDWQSVLNSASGDYIKASSYGGSALAKFFGGTVMFLSPFLGLYLIIQLVLAGYEWFTSAGEADKIKTAQKRIRNAIIGVIIIVAMYVIATFIYNMLSRATGYVIIEARPMDNRFF